MRNFSGRRFVPAASREGRNPQTRQRRPAPQSLRRAHRTTLQSCRGDLGVPGDEKEETWSGRSGPDGGRFFPPIFSGGRRGRESPGGPRRIWDVFRLSRPSWTASYSRLGRSPTLLLIRHIQEGNGNKMLPQVVSAHEWI